MEKVCEHRFFGLDPIFEPILSLITDSRLDLSQLSESVSIFAPVPFEFKSIISQKHTSLLDKNVEENDSVIIFENWKLDGGNFFSKIIQFSNILISHIREVTGGGLQDSRYLN